MSTPADYIGRTFDLLALRGAKPIGDVLLAQELFDTADAGQICTGVQKVAQRWAKRFMTVRGSKRFMPADGCDFLAVAKRGGLRNENDVGAAFSFAAMTIAPQMLATETPDMHPEDRFQRAVLEQLSLLTDMIELHVGITTVAGTKRAIILPISILPVQLD